MKAKSVNICGIEHDIKGVDDVFNSGAFHMGQINFDKCEILLNKDMPLRLRQETLCHEIVHGILVHIGYTELGENEQFVQALGNAINQSFDVKEVTYEGN